MSANVVQGTYYQYTGAQNVPATLPTLTAGNVMSLSLTAYYFATGVSGGGATWTRTVASAEAANGAVAEIWTGVGYPSSSTPVTITATYPPKCYASTDLIEISGTTGAVRSTATTSTADPISLSLTAVAGDLLVANALDSNNVTGSWTGPFSSTGANNPAFMNEQAPTTGTITGTFTGGTTSDSCAAVAVAYVALVTTGTLIADYDATTLGAVANGTPITAIQDMAQSQGVARPLKLAPGATPATLNLTGLNGHPAYVFAGASGYIGSDPALFATGEGYTVIVAFAETTTSPAANYAEALITTTSSAGGLGTALDAWNTYFTPGITLYDQSTGEPNNTLYLDGVVASGTYTPNVLHVAALTSATTAPSNAGEFGLGQYVGGSPYYLNAAIGRVLVYQGALSATDIATVTAALQNQFAQSGGITSGITGTINSISVDTTLLLSKVLINGSISDLSSTQVHSSTLNYLVGSSIDISSIASMSNIVDKMTSNSIDTSTSSATLTTSSANSFSGSDVDLTTAQGSLQVSLKIGGTSLSTSGDSATLGAQEKSSGAGVSTSTSQALEGQSDLLSGSSIDSTVTVAVTSAQRLQNITGGALSISLLNAQDSNNDIIRGVSNDTSTDTALSGTREVLLGSSNDISTTQITDMDGNNLSGLDVSTSFALGHLSVVVNPTGSDTDTSLTQGLSLENKNIKGVDSDLTTMFGTDGMIISIQGNSEDISDLESQSLLSDVDAGSSIDNSLSFGNSDESVITSGISSDNSIVGVAISTIESIFGSETSSSSTFGSDEEIASISGNSTDLTQDGSFIRARFNNLFFWNGTEFVVTSMHVFYNDSFYTTLIGALD